VLIAEEVTSRFLNVMSLLAGSIPLVAIQLNVLKVEDQLLLDFVKVLDQRALREDDAGETGGGEANRSMWEERVGSDVMKICDRIAEIANEVAEPKLELKYQKRHLGLCPHGSFFNVAALIPKMAFVAVRMGIPDSDAWLKRFQDAGSEVNSRNPGSITIRIRRDELQEHAVMVRELLHQAVREFQSS
jgi:hypothetical protein